ncbi:hypothetical protein B0H10DRAFT_2210836 [Mycena sp. CBHHK59/15]|nr:hypothetical protein B0H10DRAFT_2210836 [Mycena sp. CBHHK59/15]
MSAFAPAQSRLCVFSLRRLPIRIAYLHARNPMGTLPPVPTDPAQRADAAQFLIVHKIEPENLNMPPSTPGFIDIVVPAPNDTHDAGVDAVPDPDSPASSGDEICISVEPPDADADADDRTVRFRSRVRITSGLHHHRERDPETESRSSSPSSSISAPLRAPLTDESCSPGWGPLGRRVRIFAAARKRRPGVADLAIDERTALLATPVPKPVVHRGARGDADGEPGADSDCSDATYDSDDEDALLSRQIDLVFGKWPGRLLNRHWWWWHLQPVVGCRCLDESDGED